MGSAALGEAIKGIRSWAMNEGRVIQTPAKVKDIFGARVFNDKVQQARLPKPVYKALRDTMTRGTALDVSTADAVASALEGLGGRKRRVALHALVPAADRHHRGKARRLLRSDR